MGYGIRLDVTTSAVLAKPAVKKSVESEKLSTIRNLVLRICKLAVIYVNKQVISETDYYSSQDD